jgi:hypothetical protein
VKLRIKLGFTILYTAVFVILVGTGALRAAPEDGAGATPVCVEIRQMAEESLQLKG